MVSSMLVATSQIVAIPKRLSKKLGWNVQTVIRDKSSSVKQNGTVSSMAAIATQNVNSLLGTSPSAVTVQNVVSIWLKRKSVVAGSKSYVAMATTKKKK